MTQGTYVECLGLYLLVETSGQEVLRVSFSRQPPSEPSCIAELIAGYLQGILPFPQLKLGMNGLTSFQRRIFAAVQSIPRGETRTYSEVAALAGSPKAARAVGQVMAYNPFVILVPCHRVVGKHGLGGFGAGLDIKRKLLILEGAIAGDSNAATASVFF